jgi:hypothetical protein
MPVALHRQQADGTVLTARQHHADLGRQRQQLLQHAAHAAQFRKRSLQLLAAGDAALALAVVAQRGGLQDAGQQRFGHAGAVGRRAQHRVGRAGHTAAGEMRLLGGAVLADRQRGGRWGDESLGGQFLHHASRNVLELGADRCAELGQLLQRTRLLVGRAQVFVGRRPGRTVEVGVQHCHAVTELLRGMCSHAAELTAAQHAQPAAGRQAGGIPDCVCVVHFSSALMARAASVWRAR